MTTNFDIQVYLHSPKTSKSILQFNFSDPLHFAKFLSNSVELMKNLQLTHFTHSRVTQASVNYIQHMQLQIEFFDQQTTTNAQWSLLLHIVQKMSVFFAKVVEKIRYNLIVTLALDQDQFNSYIFCITRLKCKSSARVEIVLKKV